MGSQILVQNSQNVEVHDNIVEVASGFGNGLSVIHQDRGNGEFGPWHAVNNHLHDNTIIHLGDHGDDGIVTDTDDDWFWSESNNRFDRNTYIAPDGSHGYWRFDDTIEDWDDVQALGCEQDSKLIVERRARWRCPATRKARQPLRLRHVPRCLDSGQLLVLQALPDVAATP